jgi:mannose-6-phosphate isomerase-like protein (cupin superfamily)
MAEQPTRLEGKQDKGWGYEIIWATNDKYCVKIMVFENKGNKFSMNFHKDKDETWFVNTGKFKVQWIDTSNAALYEKELNEGDVWHNPPLQPHRLICLQGSSSITEVSTADSVEDNYRVAPGDSQKSKEEHG